MNRNSTSGQICAAPSSFIWTQYKNTQCITYLVDASWGTLGSKVDSVVLSIEKTFFSAYPRVPALYSGPGLELESDTSPDFQGLLFDLDLGTDESDLEMDPGLSMTDLGDEEIELNLFIN